MDSKITLKRELMPDVNFELAPKDVVFHCSEGLVTANSLLLAVISPSMRRLLESRREQEEQFHLSCPGLRAAHLTCFLSDVYTRDKEINVPEDVHNMLFPGIKLPTTMECDSIKTEEEKILFNQFKKEPLDACEDI